MCFKESTIFLIITDLTIVERLLIEEYDADRVKEKVLQHVGKLWKHNKHRLKRRVMVYQARAKK